MGVSANEYSVSTLAPANPTLWLGPRRKILLYECSFGMRLMADAATSPLNTYPAWGTIIACGAFRLPSAGWSQPSAMARISLADAG